MQLVVHIGWPKTGSTAVQAVCTAHADRLAGHGVHYYRNRPNLPALNALAQEMRAGRDLSPDRAAFRAWCAGIEAGTVLISAEQFATLDPARLSDLIEPARWSGITVIAYLRAQEAVLEGWYKQLVKWGNKPEIGRYLRRPGVLGGVDYATHLARWAAWCAAVPGGVLRVRRFDRAALIGGDIGADFFTMLGIDDPTLRGAADNPSPSAALVRLYLKLPPIERLQQINRIMVASMHPAATGSGDLFDPALVAQIRNRFAASNAAVRARYFPERQALFDPTPKPERRAETDGLADLLIDTIRAERGDAVADTARAAVSE